MKRDSLAAGDKSGRLTLVAPTDSSTRRWRCICECGNAVEVGAYRLIPGARLVTNSCGCLRHDTAPALRHGFARKPGLRRSEYSIWLMMRSRCNDPESISYPRYGARGIRVCPEWDADFAAFIRDVGERPSLKHSIDRVDNDGNYEPGNVRWATRSEQARNRRPRSGEGVVHPGVKTASPASGSQNGASKLTEEQVREIRARYNRCNTSATELGAEYGVMQTSISNIVARRSWKHVP